MIRAVQALRIRSQRRPLPPVRAFGSNTYWFAHRGDHWHIVSAHALVADTGERKPIPERVHVAAVHAFGIMAWIDCLSIPFFIHKLATAQLDELGHTFGPVVHSMNLWK